MKKRIAIITGASGGIGRAFTRLMLSEDIDEIWAIARSKEKLLVLQADFGAKVIAISKDLAHSAGLDALSGRLKAEAPVVAYLINNAGIAQMGDSKDFPAEVIETSVFINCCTPAVLCSMCIPYMERGSRILNISSVASFQPLPNLNLYAASKVFLRSYSRSLHWELKPLGITSTAVCPGWVDTELLKKEVNGKRIKFPGIVSPKKVAAKALRDAKKGRDMSVCTLFAKWEHLMAKLIPQRLYMGLWVLVSKPYR
ncbi:MAG TPA: short-chain dehydrogenase [Clostridiales bacterium]|nr:short-chain dehydrogenase [Clostridiales bacterium]